MGRLFSFVSIYSEKLDRKKTTRIWEQIKYFTQTFKMHTLKNKVIVVLFFFKYNFELTNPNSFKNVKIKCIRRGCFWDRDPLRVCLFVCFTFLHFFYLSNLTK